MYHRFNLAVQDQAHLDKNMGFLRPLKSECPIDLMCKNSEKKRIIFRKFSQVEENYEIFQEMLQS